MFLHLFPGQTQTAAAAANVRGATLSVQGKERSWQWLRPLAVSEVYLEGSALVEPSDMYLALKVTFNKLTFSLIISLNYI